MARESHVEINGRSVRLRELTLREVDAWLADAAQGLIKPESRADGLMTDGTCLVSELLRFSDDLTWETVQELTPSETELLWSEVRRLNDRFFTLRGQLLAGTTRTRSDSSAAADASAPA